MGHVFTTCFACRKSSNNKPCCHQSAQMEKSLRERDGPYRAEWTREARALKKKEKEKEKATPIVFKGGEKKKADCVNMRYQHNKGPGEWWSSWR